MLPSYLAYSWRWRQNASVNFYLTTRRHIPELAQSWGTSASLRKQGNEVSDCQLLSNGPIKWTLQLKNRHDTARSFGSVPRHHTRSRCSVGVHQTFFILFCSYMNHNIKEGESEVKIKKKTFCLCKHRPASFPQGHINKHSQVSGVENEPDFVSRYQTPWPRTWAETHSRRLVHCTSCHCWIIAQLSLRLIN
jgi:hypothetical protein